MVSCKLSKFLTVSWVLIVKKKNIWYSPNNVTKVLYNSWWHLVLFFFKRKDDLERTYKQKMWKLKFEIWAFTLDAHSSGSFRMCYGSMVVLGGPRFSWWQCCDLGGPRLKRGRGGVVWKQNNKLCNWDPMPIDQKKKKRSHGRK